MKSFALLLIGFIAGWGTLGIIADDETLFNEPRYTILFNQETAQIGCAQVLDNGMTKVLVTGKVLREKAENSKKR